MSQADVTPAGPSPLDARSATTTVVAQTAARAVALGAMVLSTAIVARALTVEQYADWVTVLSLVALVAFVLDPGVSPVIVRRLAQQPDEAPRPAAMLRVRLLLGAGAYAAIVAIALALRGADAWAIALALGAQVVPRSLVLNATAWLQVDHRLHRQTALEAVVAGIGLAGLGVAVALDASPAVLALAGLTLPACLLAVLVRRELLRTPSAALASPGAQGPKVRAVLVEVAPLAVALALTTLYSRSYTVFVNAAEDSAGVALFLFAFLFVEQIIVVAGIVGNALLPLVANRARGTDLLGDELTADVTVGLTALGALGAGLLLVLADPLARLVGGPDLADAGRFIELLAPTAPVYLLAVTLGYIYLSVGLIRRYLWFNLAALAFNLTAHALFTLDVGASAAARIAWMTELVVVALSFWPLARGSAAGARAALRNAILLGAVVAGAELTGAGEVAPALAAAGVVLVTLLVARGALTRFGGEIVRGRRAAPQPSSSR
jgi:O-antigen/teichoic acid export membrane protein